MKTDHLITALAADTPAVRQTAGKRALLLVPLAASLVLLGFLLFLRVRPDLTEGAVWPAVGVKVLAASLLAILALRLALVLGEPGRSGRNWRRRLLVVPAVLACALAVELARMGAADWQARLVGMNQLRCLMVIPLLSLLPLLGLLVALRQGAVTRPGLAGAVSGLAATGIGAVFYALNCTDDSMLFVLTWYALASLIVAIVGAVLAPFLLRW
jgi:hypothetical protein